MRTIILLYFLCLNAFAVFTLNPDTGKGFKKNNLNIIISSSDCTNAGFSTSTFKDYVEDAVNDYWNQVSTSALNLNVKAVNTSLDITGLTFEQALNTVPTNTILAGCNSTGAPSFDGSGNPSGKSSILGAAVMECSGKNCRSVLIINSHPTNSVADLNRSNLIATIAHEIGHAIGLGHASTKHNLMYYAVGGKVQNWLGSDDIKGVTYLYPHEEEMSCLFGNIGSIKDSNDNDTLGGMKLMIISFLAIVLFIQMLQLLTIKVKNNFLFFINS